MTGKMAGFASSPTSSSTKAEGTEPTRQEINEFFKKLKAIPDNKVLLFASTSLVKLVIL